MTPCKKIKNKKYENGNGMQAADNWQKQKKKQMLIGK